MRQLDLTCLFLCGVCFALTPLWVGLAKLSSIETAAIRALLAGGLGLLVFGVTKKHSDKVETLPNFRKMLLGLTSCVSLCTFAAAFVYTRAEYVYLLYYTFPFQTIAWDFLIHKLKITRRELVSVSLALCGLLCCWLPQLQHGQIRFGTGEFLATISAVCWMMHIKLANNAIRRETIVFHSLLWQLIVGTFLTGLVIYNGLPSLTGLQVLGGTSLGVFAAAALWFWSMGIRTVPGYVAGTMLMVEVPLGIVVTAIVLRRGIDTSAIIGALIIATAAVILLRKDTKMN